MNLAPNGKPSNLTPEQYKLVRTPEFKEWFGDWENNSFIKKHKGHSEIHPFDTISLDENGEPKIWYRSAHYEYNEIEQEFIYLGNKKSYVKQYGKPKDFFVYPYKTIFIDNEDLERQHLGIKFDYLTEYISEENGIPRKGSAYNKLKNIYKNQKEPLAVWEYFTLVGNIEKLELFKEWFQEFGFDSICYWETGKKNNFGKYPVGKIILYFGEEYLKLADGTNKTFDSENPDIRFDGGGLVFSVTGRYGDKRATNESIAKYIANKVGSDLELYYKSGSGSEYYLLKNIKNQWQDGNMLQLRVSDHEILSRNPFLANSGGADISWEKPIYDKWDIEELDEWIDEWILENIEDGNYVRQESPFKNGGNVPDEFWGNQAGGVLIICSRTNKVLLLKRSPYVQEPETWGIISGKIDAGETIEEAVAREVKEETGWKIDNLIPSYVFKKNDFTFYNFISVVDIEFTPKLDWENTDYGWFDLSNLPENLHFGVEILLLKDKYLKGLRYASVEKGLSNLKGQGLNINDKEYQSLVKLRAELEQNRNKHFREGGYVKSKKVYVSIKLPYNFEKENEKDIMKSFYRYEDKPFQELQEHKLVGVIGVSKSRENIADWLIFRDCLIVMNYDEFMQLNDATEIEYDNPEQLMANDLELFNRLYGNKREENEEEFNTKSHRRNNLSKILQSFPFEFKIAGKVEKDNQLKNELYRIEYFTNQNETGKFMGWLERNQYIINSPQEFADLIIKYHYSDESKSEISSFYGNTDNLKITSEYIYPIVYKALIKAGSTYTDEQEIIINNRVLNIPDDSQLFFVKKEKSNQDELIEKYKLKDTYRVAFVKQENIDRFRGQIDKKRTEYFNQKREINLKELEEKSKAILPLLLQEIKLNISEYYYSKAKNLFDKDNYYKDYEGDDTKYYSVEDIPEVKQLLRGALDVIESVFNETFYSSDVKEIDKYKFSNFTWLANEKLKEYINSVDNTLSDEIFKYHNEYNDTIYANELTWTLRELFDYGESPIKELDKVALAQRYVELMEGDMFRYYSEQDLNIFKKGGKTIAQTPAPKKDQIKGSAKNKKGSSKDIKSAKSIELSEKTIKSIKNKIDEHNSKYPKKKINLASAKAVVRRGMGAYSSSHRPTIKGGKPNSRVAWGLARLNAFIYKIVNGKSKSGKYSQDNDLIKELGYKVQKYSEGGSAETNNNEEMKNVSVSINMYWGEIDSIYDGIKIESPEDNVHFMEWADENNFDYEQWGESELIDTSWGYEYIVPFNDYKNYIINSRNKRYGGGELKKGIKTEMEHKDTIEKIKSGNYSTKQSAEMIAKDHLKENDKYYTHLSEMESKFDDGGYIIDEDIVSNNIQNPVVGMAVMNKDAGQFDSVEYVLDVFDDGNGVRVGDDAYNEGIGIANFRRTYRPATQEEVNRSKQMSKSLLELIFKNGGQTPAQQEKIAKVMGEFKRGELNTSYGTKVTDDKQAIAIALSEAGVEKKEEGGVIEGQLHTECNDDSGCGEKFDVGGVGNIIEAERDEAVIVSSAFSDTNRYKIKGTPSQIASALNVMGGGKNFDGGAIIDFNGKIIDTNNIRKETNDTDVKNDIESGSVIINRRSMYDNTIYEVEGTPKQIASAINSVNGYGVVIENGATIKEA